MLSFFSSTFALAGLAAALAPVLIHLLNQRRYKVVPWAAMDLLREAVHRHRRMLRLRDILLLLLRMASVALFGLAMARPYFSSSGAAAVPDQPLHAVILVDNSLSMSYQELGGTWLDLAKSRARELIDLLPKGSWISIVPLCGGVPGISKDAYRTREDALEALQLIEAVERRGSAAQAVDLAVEACAQVTELPSKRVIFLGDQQANGWPSAPLGAELEKLPEMQVVQVAAPNPENAWVSDFKVRDGIADADTPTTLIALVRFEGRAARTGVPVTLSIDGVPAATRTVDLEPGQSREVSFSYTFAVPVEPGRAAFVPASVSIPHDQLPEDDQRFLLVPVVAALPVVFIDQYGEDEDARKNRYGETFRLRRLLQPRTSRGDRGQDLVQIRHRRMDQVDRELLQDARLCVIAGVEKPGGAVGILRDFVRQGGQLVVAAGADFDPAAWSSAGWLDGNGILPAPLKAQPIGRLPDESTDAPLEPFFLAFETLTPDYFLMDDASRQEMQDLYGAPLFFKAVEADLSEETMARARESAKRTASEPEPSWLLWKDASRGAPADSAVPRALARFTNQAPFLIERSLGRGRLLFIASAIQSNWNTLTRSNAVLIFDRIFRSLIERTLPRRNFQPMEQIILPVEAADQRARFVLSRPQGPKPSEGEEMLTVDALGADAYGLTVRDANRRGIYTIQAYRTSGGQETAGARLWAASVAMNGPEEESDLKLLDEKSLTARAGPARWRWVGRGDAISLEGSQISGQDLWKWVMLAVLAALLLETFILSLPNLTRRREGSSMTGAMEWVGRLLGLEDVESVGQLEPSFGASWAHDAPAWIFFGCLFLSAAAFFFYLRLQNRGSRKARMALAAGRSLLLCVLFLTLAEPILRIKITTKPKPLLWLLFDGTDSMAIEDELPEAERAKLAEAAGVEPGSGKLSRMGYVQAFLRKKDSNLLARLGEKFRLKPFLFERPDSVRALELPASRDPSVLASRLLPQLTTAGQVTALGSALEDLSRRQSSRNLAGLIVVSDFDQNAGPSPVSAARKLGVPVHTIGVGPASAVDIAVELRAPLLMKKAERASLNIMLRQTGLDGRSVNLKLSARRIEGGPDAPAPGSTTTIAEKRVDLTSATIPVEVPYTPPETGRFIFSAEVEKLEGEVVEKNNRSEREVNIRDDFLRLLYVEYEPTWEWRFIKEVFHRDQLVGMRGFRTYLRSADPKVRQTNEVFQATLTPQRSEFFANDVIFLGDMPASALTTRFCENVKELVSKFGGGLVVIAGPRFGPGELAQTPLADILPVVVDPNAHLRADHDFRLKLAPDAAQIDFMQLGTDGASNLKAWDNLGALPWYQPVSRLHPLGSALAVHPSDASLDGKTPQPIIAIRRYGSGEVVYVGFNETWRLRRKYGEQHYRQLWGQMIHRLGLSHALGTQKRFVVRTDRQQYQADDKVFLTVEAYDASFEPLTEEKLPGRTIEAELILPGRAGAQSAGPSERVSVTQAREGIFEARIPVFKSGEHLVRVKDPITQEKIEINFQVSSLSAERRSAVRNVALQGEISAATGGKSFDLQTAGGLEQEINAPETIETSIRVFALWNTWFTFAAVLLLMIGEWLFRKLVSLP